jgi:hypothetical protein
VSLAGDYDYTPVDTKCHEEDIEQYTRRVPGCGFPVELLKRSKSPYPYSYQRRQDQCCFGYYRALYKNQVSDDHFEVLVAL